MARKHISNSIVHLIYYYIGDTNHFHLPLCIASTQNDVDICDIITCVCNPVNPQQNSHCFRPNGNSEHSSDIGPNMDNSSEELLRITTQQNIVLNNLRQLIASAHNKMAVQS
ncbi:unnamed protein product [Brugia pahangi]|uniref:Uncharacterized protein n=1 Tax=Brugia pahangi TaxID=6280 RepID=A0A0N4T0A4_BRUPA|nr:unnamed protein product [Brugia pahangi]